MKAAPLSAPLALSARRRPLRQRPGGEMRKETRLCRADGFDFLSGRLGRNGPIRAQRAGEGR